MKLSEYQAGSFETEGDGSFFRPALLNQPLEIDSPLLHQQLEKASHALGTLNSMAKLVPNIDLFINCISFPEATSSSRIEGTQTTIGDSFKKEKHIPIEKRDDWQEVQLYIKALNQAVARLGQLPIANRLIRETHAILMSSRRGANKAPGEYRKSQNWIGGNSLQTAVFVPPRHLHIADLMADLEKFLNDKEHPLPELVRIGIAHYQFEAIHPFLDGNGRVGRMLIVLFLLANRLLDKPLLYISVFFEKHRQIYYDKLTRVHRHNDLAGWLLFFLEGIEQVALFSSDTLQQTLDLKSRLEKKIRAETGNRARNNLRLLDYAFASPSLEIADIANHLQVVYTTASNTAKDLERLQILQKVSVGKRNKLLLFAPYLNILQRPFIDC